MKNSADLGGYYPPRPSTSVDNTLLVLQNSSYPAQPHSIIANSLYAGVQNPAVAITVIRKLVLVFASKDFPN